MLGSSIPARTIVGNGLLLRSFNHEFEEDSAVVFENDVILECGKTAEMRKKYGLGAKFIDAEGKIIRFPDINAHGHYYGYFSRGCGKPKPSKTFLEVLENLWWRLDKALDHEDNYLSAAAYNIAAIKSGVTTIVDHHASPSCIEGSLDDIAQANLDCGIRSHLAYEVTDRNGMDGAMAGVEENRRFIERCYKTNKNPLLAASFGLHAQFTCSDKTLDACKEALESVKEARGKVGFHIHVGEGLYDEEHCIKNYGMPAVHRLVEHGICGKESIYGHCVHVNDDELELVKKTGTTVVTNPTSNMNNAVGLPRVMKMLQMGIPVCLGTDGITYDMTQELKALYFANKHLNKDPRVMGYESMEILANNNAAFVSKAFERKVGVLEPGAYADLIIVDYPIPTVLTRGNLPWHIVFGMSGANVDTTIVGGRVLMRHRKLLTVDEEEIAAKCRERTPIIWEKL